MLELLRRFTRSRIGVGATLGVLVLIALAFASGDIASNRGFGGVAGGDRVASVGNARVSTSQLSQAATNALENMKQQDPRLTMRPFIASGGLDKVLEALLDRTALTVFGQKHGIVASDRLIDSEITKIPAFRGPDGKFSDTAFRQMIQQRGLSEKMIRVDLAQGLVARQLLVPAAFGAIVPSELVLRYAALLREHRSGAIALLPSAAFAPKTPPSEAELTAYYTRNHNNFIRPERRILRFASFGDSALRNVPAPSETEIRARYNDGKARYTALETRQITQLIVPTEAAAKEIVAEVSKGTKLEAAASTKGLSTSSLGAVSKEALAGLSSQAVADACFAAASGTIAAPAHSALGWHVMRIDAIERRAERTLEQVRGELTAQIADAKRRAALNDLSARIEDEFNNGGNLADAAKELGLTPQITPELTADGQLYGKPGQKAPPMLARVIQTAFAMERENQPQIAEVEAGKTFVIFDVTQIAASAPAPLADIRAEVIAELTLEKGAVAARAAADKILAEVRKGKDLGAAMAALGRPLPPVKPVEMGREQLTALGQQVPPPLTLLFSMAQGTVKSLAAPQNRGFFIVALKRIAPAMVSAKDPILPTVQGELGQMVGREYAAQLSRAIRAEVGIKRNEVAIRAVRTQLSGGN